MRNLIYGKVFYLTYVSKSGNIIGKFKMEAVCPLPLKVR